MTEQEWLKSTDPEKMLEFLGDRFTHCGCYWFSAACQRRVLLRQRRDKEKADCKRSIELYESIAEGRVLEDALYLDWPSHWVRPPCWKCGQAQVRNIMAVAA